MQMQSQTALSSTPHPAAAPGALTARLGDIGRRHGFGLDAVRAMWDAVALGRGGMAQFSHAEFGGSGQWMRGGMVMVGDMFNRALAARVGALADELAQLHDEHPGLAAAAPAGEHGTGAEWWPAGLHSPATSGAQNGVRYAWFPIQRRLAIERDGTLELYDTQDHLIGGASQQQGDQGTLRFSSQHGPLDLAALPRVTGGSGAEAGAQVALTPAGPAPRPAGAPHDVLDTIDQLAGLHQRGVLSDDEFKTKKAELLARL